ncbi:MAG: hypothetical protein HY680_09525 [Chloroflexi bacterium]|nr:hypothetical protein [Chloroflexota bacterium]
MTHPSEQLSQEFIAGQLGRAYQPFDAATRARHMALLQAVAGPQDVALNVVPERANEWAITLCAWDCLGALSLIAGLFACYRINIQSVDVFTVHLPEALPAKAQVWDFRRRRTVARRPAMPLAPPLPNRKILDIFHVRALEEVAPTLWERFREDLSRLIGLAVGGHGEEAQESILDRVSQAVATMPEAERLLFPVSVEVDNDASTDFTQLSLRAADTVGFLFAFANALTMLNINIERAEIRTRGSEVHDTFWLTDSTGRKVSSQERLQDIRAAAALIKQFTYLLPRSPNPAQALRQFNALTQQMLANPDWSRELRDMESAGVLSTLAEMMGVSQFLWEDFLRMQHENLFPVLVDTPALERGKPLSLLRQSLRQALSRAQGREAKVQELNRFKDREMFRIDLRHITRRIGFQEFSEELSDLAEAVVEGAWGLSYDSLREQHGEPALPGDGACPWCACALGKFGGRELGFGSDIELLFVYQEEGATEGPSSITSSLFFNSMVRGFLAALVTRREGIFEVDLRLRPYGSKGPLASSLAAFREYYTGGGFARQFERMALVKLRPVAGDAKLAAKVLQARDDFVYTGASLDMENLLHLRGRQANELVPAGQVSAKYSPGGLVDVEYYAQAWQVLVGRQDQGVRVTNTLEAIDRLAHGGHLSQGQAEELREVYSFLRRLIDALRAVRGHAKDLTIPPTDSREFAYLAHRLAYPSAQALREAITGRMEYAAQLWEGMGQTS